MHISKMMKKKRDAEARLNRQSEQPVYVGSGGAPTPGGSPDPEGGSIPGDTYITYETIVNNISNVLVDHLLAGDNISLVDNNDGTYTISTEASIDLMFDGGTANSNDFTVTFDGGGA